MRWLGVAVAVVTIGVILLDAFEVIIFPRRVRHAFRPARLFYRSTWFVWGAGAGKLPAGRWRQAWLSIFGPLSLLALLALWGVALILGFALLHWCLGTGLTVPENTGRGFDVYVYFSGTTFFTLGYGDVVTTTTLGRALSVTEAGIGFGFLAITISYLPILYQAFSRREITISLCDARAGSPPTAGELLRRLGEAGSMTSLGALLTDWERWSAELLESHLSYPVLSFYRSQHDNQSWVGTLTTILDTSALLIAAVDSPAGWQARLTFAMARHAAVDLSLVSQTPATTPPVNRMSESDLNRLQDTLRKAGVVLREGPRVAEALAELRALYEPFVGALSEFFRFALPPFQPDKPPVDNWQTSAWMARSPSLGRLPAARVGDEHFD